MKRKDHEAVNGKIWQLKKDKQRKLIEWKKLEKLLEKKLLNNFLKWKTQSKQNQKLYIMGLDVMVAIWCLSKELGTNAQTYLTLTFVKIVKRQKLILMHLWNLKHLNKQWSTIRINLKDHLLELVIVKMVTHLNNLEKWK